MRKKITLRLAALTLLTGQALAQSSVISVDLSSPGRVYEGIGGLSAGASSRLLADYPEPQKSQVLDLLFKPNFGASLNHLKVEIGGDVNSTDGTEPSHAHSYDEWLHPKPAYFQRGYEWMLLRGAKKRNPAIKLDCLAWGVPGWIGEGRYYSQQNADYLTSFIKGARQHHNLTFDYTGIWNERAYDTNWIKILRKTLNQSGLDSVKIVAGDVFDFKIAEQCAADQELDKAVQAYGVHYNENYPNSAQMPNAWAQMQWKDNPFGSSPQAKQSGKPLYYSEGGPWRGDWAGARLLGQIFNREYLNGRITRSIIWSLVTSYYDNLSLPNSGLFIAKTPWSGHYEVQPAVWIVAHTTQFAHPGWQYLDRSSGYLPAGGSYVTLRSPDSHDVSMVLETFEANKPEAVTIQLPRLADRKTVTIWRSQVGGDEFVRWKTLPYKSIITFQADTASIYTITTTTGQQKGSFANVPADKPFPLPYQTDFEADSIGQMPRYLADQGGSFEVVPRLGDDGKTTAGHAIRQLVRQRGIEWETGDDAHPATIVGDTTWTDYTIRVDGRLAENTGTLTLGGRIIDTHRGIAPFEGYWLRFTRSKWELYAGARKLKDGDSYRLYPFGWHTYQLQFRSNTITGSVDGRPLFTVEDTRYKRGMVSLGSGYNLAEFDNLSINP
ncbi:hypothetical protein [Fibrella aquatilis]|uniref:galactosylceramidase n=1 Tax=Fibrella aquatilis TaxID=2817059 RepID=A0A939G7C1_9BACT|nr:hypothetical protein [Fibrella aquatilis]MBO0931979.1 hypothetical protein [Fibrella aquatilis]